MKDRDATFAFTGANAVFRRLVTRGALLELVTFGFYRFWLTTDMRRYLWSNTEIDGDALEYTGRGKELFLGFSIALAILIPVFFVYSLTGLAMDREQAFASVPLYAFIYLFGQFAIYRARRYRLTRTVWRGVRFWMTGSGWSYAWRAALWMVPVVVTLGFAYPWQMAALERYKFARTHYGTAGARFDGTGGQLFARIWWIWMLGLLPFGTIFASMLSIIITAQSGPVTDNPWTDLLSGTLFLACGLSVALPFLHAARKAVEWRWWANNIRFGDASIQCDLKTGALIRTYWSAIGMGILAALGVATLAGIAASSVYFGMIPLGSVDIAGELAPILAPVEIGIWYVATILAFGVIARIYLLQRIWKRVCNACTLHNADALTDIATAGEAANALGEGLADGLDFAGF